MVVKGKPLTLKEQWQKLLDELRPMTPKKKWEHLWEYYKWVLGVLAIVVFIVALVVSSIINVNTEVLASGMIINADVNTDGYGYLSDVYYETRKSDTGRQRVDLSYRTYEDAMTSEDPGYNYDVLQSVVAMVAAEALDYLLMDQVALEAFLMPDYLMDLRELFTEEELAQMGDKVVKLIVEETGETIPVAIDISNSQFCATYMNSSKRATFMAFSITTPRPEVCREMWERIMVLEQ